MQRRGLGVEGPLDGASNSTRPSGSLRGLFHLWCCTRKRYVSCLYVHCGVVNVRGFRSRPGGAVPTS